MDSSAATENGRSGESLAQASKSLTAVLIQSMLFLLGSVVMQSFRSARMNRKRREALLQNTESHTDQDVLAFERRFAFRCRYSLAELTESLLGYVRLAPLIEALQATKMDDSKKEETVVDADFSRLEKDVVLSFYHDEGQSTEPCSSVKHDEDKSSSMRAEITRLQAELKTKTNENSQLRDENQVLLKAEDKLAYLAKHEQTRSGTIVHLAERCKKNHTELNAVRKSKSVPSDRIEFDDTKDGMFCQVLTSYLDLFTKNRKMERDLRKYEFVSAGKKRLEAKLVDIEHSREPLTEENSTLIIALKERVAELEESLKQLDDVMARDERHTIYLRQLRRNQSYFEGVSAENKELKAKIQEHDSAMKGALQAQDQLYKELSNATAANTQYATQYTYLENHIAEYKQWAENQLSKIAANPFATGTQAAGNDMWAKLQGELRTAQSDLVREKKHSTFLIEKLKHAQETHKAELAGIAKAPSNSPMYVLMADSIQKKRDIITRLHNEVSDLKKAHNKSEAAKEDYEKRVSKLTAQIDVQKEKDRRHECKDDRPFQFFENVNKRLKARLEQLEFDSAADRAQMQREHNVALHAVKIQLSDIQQDDKQLKESEAQKARDLAAAHSQIEIQADMIHKQKAAYDELIAKLSNYMDKVDQKAEMLRNLAAGSDGDDEDEDDGHYDSSDEETDSLDEEDEEAYEEEREEDDEINQHDAHENWEDDHVAFDSNDENDYEGYVSLPSSEWEDLEEMEDL